MRTISVALALSVLLTGAAKAQGGMMPGPGTPHSTGGGGGYTGPCDTVTFKGWYGLRACGSATATGLQKSMNVQRASDSTTSDILILSTGDFDIATATTFCAATTCTIQKVYDQSGNGNDLSTPHSMRLLTSGCTDTAKIYCMFGFSGYISGTISSTIIGYEEAVGTETSSTTTNQNWTATAPSGNAPSIGNGPASTNSIYIYAGNVLSGTAANTVSHVIQGIYGTSGILSVDGVNVSTGTTGAPAAQTVFQLGNNPSGNTNLYEVGFSDTAPSSGNRTTVCHNAFVYWGTSTSC